jgi:hypothetical protein
MYVWMAWLVQLIKALDPTALCGLLSHTRPQFTNAHPRERVVQPNDRLDPSRSAHVQSSPTTGEATLGGSGVANLPSDRTTE